MHALTLLIDEPRVHKDQDTLALDGLYRRFAPMMFRRCKALLGSEDEARDALHDLFLQVQDRLHTFRESSSLSTWLYRVTTNHCLNRIRNQSNRVRLNEGLSTPKSYDPRPHFERRDLLFSLLKRLDTKDVQIALYRHFDGMTQPEIAEVMEVSERTVRNRLRALEKNVAQALQEEL